MLRLLFSVVFLLRVPSDAVRTDRDTQGHRAKAASSDTKHVGASQVGCDFVALILNNLTV